MPSLSRKIYRIVCLCRLEGCGKEKLEREKIVGTRGIKGRELNCRKEEMRIWKKGLFRKTREEATEVKHTHTAMIEPSLPNLRLFM